MVDGEKLRQARLKRRWSQNRAAAESGVSQTQISALERGKIDSPQMDTLQNLARAYGVPVQDVLISEEERQQLVQKSRQAPTSVAVSTPRDLLRELERRLPVYAPVLKGRVLASHWSAIPSDQIERYEPVEEVWEGKTLLGVTVAGSCLEPEISAGDTVFYEPEQPFETGAMVVVWHDDDYRVKYAVESSQQRWELCSHNDPPLHANGETQVLGPVRRIVKRPGRWRTGT